MLAFDIYPAQVQMAGGKSVLIPLIPPDGNSEAWYLDFQQLENAITPKTKLFVLNTPHNPTGKKYDFRQHLSNILFIVIAIGRVFSLEELQKIADILEKHPHVICVCDEVYENLVFSSKGHTRLGSLPKMWGRVITVSSAGKTFSVTGWKIGWAIGSKELIEPIILGMYFTILTVYKFNNI